MPALSFQNDYSTTIVYNTVLLPKQTAEKKKYYYCNGLVAQYKKGNIYASLYFHPSILQQQIQG